MAGALMPDTFFAELESMLPWEEREAGRRPASGAAPRGDQGQQLGRAERHSPSGGCHVQSSLAAVQ